jgi:diguanylate cyclase (GGDEF)-like protein/PAS domain S-box-containing protein
MRLPVSQLKWQGGNTSLAHPNTLEQRRDRLATDQRMMQARHLPSEFFHRAFDQTAVGMGFVGVDGRWMAVNASLCAMLGYPEAQLVTMSWREVTHPDDIETEVALIDKVWAGTRSSYSIRKRCLRRDRSIVEMLVQVTMAPPVGADPAFFIVQLLDLPRALAEEEANRQQEKIRLLVENVSDAFIGMDEDGYVTEWNRQAERILQWRADEIIGKQMAPMLVPERYREQHAAGLQRFIRTGVATIINKPVEVPLLRKDGAEIPAEMTIGAARHLGRYYFATFVRDISERKELERQLHRQATHDHLTGLPNRFEFMRRLGQQVAAAERAGNGPFALMFIDLDGFKQVNDIHGHQEGDKLLTSFASALQHCVRRTDVVGRLAGDEFVVLVTGVKDVRGDAAVVAKKILAAAAACSNATAPVSASIGIALFERFAKAEDLMKRSDTAMYAAKEAGKNQFVFHCDLGASGG